MPGRFWDTSALVKHYHAVMHAALRSSEVEAIVEDRGPWQPLLREALAALALPADEQIRVNGPGCVACDLLNDFDHGRLLAVGNDPPLPEEQRRILDAIDSVMRSMQAPDFECFNN